MLALLPGALWAQGRQAPLQPQALVARPTQDFVANAPGTYVLPAIQAAANGWVLEANWVPRRLSRYTHGAVTLMSFVYTYCSDPGGCPLAYATFKDLRERVIADPALRGKVRFVSLSFDPTHDTPQAMQRYGSDYLNARELPWHFLTTYSMRFLKPILADYGQDVEVELDAKGSPTRVRTHMLKVFLIDPELDFIHLRHVFETQTLLMQSTHDHRSTTRGSSCRRCQPGLHS